MALEISAKYTTEFNKIKKYKWVIALLLATSVAAYSNTLDVAEPSPDPIVVTEYVLAEIPEPVVIEKIVEVVVEKIVEVEKIIVITEFVESSTDIGTLEAKPILDVEPEVWWEHDNDGKSDSDDSDDDDDNGNDDDDDCGGHGHDHGGHGGHGGGHGHGHDR